MSTSDGYQATSPEIAVQKESSIPAVAEISAPEIQSPSIELEGYAIEMLRMKSVLGTLPSRGRAEFRNRHSAVSINYKSKD